MVDGLDNMEARYAVNRACVKLGVPYVFGAVATTTGNVSTIVPGKTVCLECFYGKKSGKFEVVGIHPSAVNIIASVEVSEAIRLLIGVCHFIILTEQQISVNTIMMTSQNLISQFILVTYY